MVRVASSTGHRRECAFDLGGLISAYPHLSATLMVTENRSDRS
jgi:hypothetical protein